MHTHIFAREYTPAGTSGVTVIVVESCHSYSRSNPERSSLYFTQRLYSQLRYESNYSLSRIIAQSAGAVEYTDCTSAEG